MLDSSNFLILHPVYSAKKSHETDIVWYADWVHRPFDCPL
jgi:hypothetical protein